MPSAIFTAARNANVSVGDVGIDANQFAPLAEEDLLFYKNTVIGHYDEEVFVKGVVG